MQLPGLKREIDQIAKDKGINRDLIVEALEEAMKQAARRKYGQEKELEARFNDELGEIELFEFRTVVTEVNDPESEITLAAAHEFDPEAEEGDEIGVKLETEGFGRILAQTAKQVIIQKVRDAERDIIFNEYRDRKGEVVNGIVRRFEKGSLIVDLGRAEAVLPAKEQVPRENYRPGERVRAYVMDVSSQTKGPQILLSRASIEMLTKLFEQEVPEMYEGIVTIESAAREPGGRSKIAVASRDSDVDPVGACVGMKGSRVQAVVQELRGERIDIVPYSLDPARYVCSALSPAAVSKVIIDEAEKSMDVIVPDDQLSLAIGRRGQNVRLAVQLTGWRIDIKSESKMREVAQWLAEAVSVVDGCGEPEAEILLQQGIASLEDLSTCQSELLSQLPGIDEAGAGRIKARAGELAVQKAEEEARAAEEAVVREAEEAAAAAAAAAAEAAGEGVASESGEPPAEEATPEAAAPDAEATEAPAEDKA
ncbi:MAG: transcription termination/antitermination protein NusA [Deltaproteobacteria bacterium]|nr:transcription termination/antitermination protein NusA [Deltaproteobacteria bacterium]MBW2446780.1 transcription termination/antitermination protein NusA [Deltaproteobacteria bacterium]